MRMKTLLTVSAICLLAVAASACTGLGAGNGAGSQILTNLQGCQRSYNGVISAGLGASFSGSVKIECPAGQPPASIPGPDSSDRSAEDPAT